FLLSFLGVILAIVFDSIAHFGIRHLKLPRGVAVVSAAVIFLIVLFGAVVLLVMPIMNEGRQLIRSLPEKTEPLAQKLDQYRQQFPWLEHVLPAKNAAPKEEDKPKPAEVAKKTLFTLSAAIEWLARALVTFFVGLFF